jgi:hypothetical protein
MAVTKLGLVWLAGLGVAACCGEGRSTPQDGAAAPASVTPTLGPLDCPRTFAALTAPASGADISCTCSGTAATGPVRGSGIYTVDSVICRAAIHAGAMLPQGGTVTIRATHGCPSYQGSTNNGVVTLAAEAAPASYYFPSVSDGKCGGQGTDGGTGATQVPASPSR